ncbi:hypothetical protein TNCV_2929171 [Trichonephila clavipes]|nr:hypothetical protein TNCV_2929171 [Trichonephila clavipes]
MCTVGGDSIMHILEFFPFVPVYQSFPVGSQNGYEVCSKASVGGRERLRLAVAHDLLNTINTEPDLLRLLAVLENENAMKGFRFQSRDETMQNATVVLNTIPKETFQKCFRQWEECWAV